MKNFQKGFSTFFITTILGLLVLVIGGGIYVYMNKSINVKPYVTITPSSELQNYIGINGYGMFSDFPDLTEPFDPSGYNLEKYNLNKKDEYRAFNFKNQNAYAFVHTYDNGRTITVQNSVVVLDKNTKNVEEYPLPDFSDSTHVSKVGDNIFIHYLYRTDYQVLKPSDNRYYVFNVSSRKLEQLAVDSSDLENIWYRFYVIPNPDNGNIFAIGYCNKQGFDDCIGFGVAISDSHYLKKVIDVKMPFTIGWKNDKLFVNKENMVYLVDPNDIK